MHQTVYSETKTFQMYCYCKDKKLKKKTHFIRIMLLHVKLSFFVAFRNLKLIQVVILVNMKVLILNNKASIYLIVVLSSF